MGEWVWRKGRGNEWRVLPAADAVREDQEAAVRLRWAQAMAQSDPLEREWRRGQMQNAAWTADSQWPQSLSKVVLGFDLTGAK